VNKTHQEPEAKEAAIKITPYSQKKETHPTREKKKNDSTFGETFSKQEGWRPKKDPHPPTYPCSRRKSQKTGRLHRPFATDSTTTTEREE